MTEVLCTICGHVGEPKAGSCAKCRGAALLPADSPLARKFIEERNARRSAGASSGQVSQRAQATGKVLGRALGKLMGK